MRTIFMVIVVCFVLAGSVASQQPSAASAQSDADHLRVILLGSGGGPAPNPQRFGISTLVVAGMARADEGIWKINAIGGAPPSRLVTGDAAFPIVTPDNRHVIFQ